MVHDISKNTVVSLAQNQNIIQSILAKNQTWTETDVRKRIDDAWGVIQSYSAIIRKEVEPEHDGNCCMDCGSINLSPTGNCKVCLQCGASQGCS